MCLAALLVLTSATHAEFISGSVNFSSGAGGGITLQDSTGNITTNLAAATAIQSWSLSEVEEGTGSFDSVPTGSSVSFSPLPVFNPSPSTTPLWTIAGPESFSFSLTSSVTLFQNGSFLAISANGIFTGTNYDPTPGTWLFTTQGSNPQGSLRRTQSKFSWSSSAVTARVPDGGTTAALMGGSLLGLFGLRRKVTV